jgi:hypothetical protein|tara:strand:+ start:11888 stop:13030 length:1143 start_codon:yes stop_codon:yes gene_type:complete
MARRKQKTVYLTPEPDWEKHKEIVDEEERNKAFQDCQYFIRTEISDKKRLTEFKTWIKKESGWPTEEIEVILRNPDWNFNSTGTTVFFLNKVGYAPQSHWDHITKLKDEWLVKGAKIAQVKEEKAKDKPNRPSIQEIMLGKLMEAGGEIDGILDQFFEDEIKIDAKFNTAIMRVLNAYNPLPNHIPQLVDSYTKEQKEFKEVIEGKDEQLVEAYNHLSKRKVKSIIVAYDNMIGVLNSYQALKIKNRAKRKTKPITPEKATQKLKYQKRFECEVTKLKLESIRPAELHMSKEAWCYDTAKRKLHHYIAEEMAGEMFVKGNTLYGFDKSKSAIKTLRKPKEQIKEIMGSKPAARKFFDSIKAVGVQPKGRFNDQMIILKAF